jgi:hypothetical protein
MMKKKLNMGINHYNLVGLIKFNNASILTSTNGHNVTTFFMNKNLQKNASKISTKFLFSKGLFWALTLDNDFILSKSPIEFSSKICEMWYPLFSTVLFLFTRFCR